MRRIGDRSLGVADAVPAALLRPVELFIGARDHLFECAIGGACHGQPDADSHRDPHAAWYQRPAGDRGTQALGDDQRSGGRDAGQHDGKLLAPEAARNATALAISAASLRGRTACPRSARATAPDPELRLASARRSMTSRSVSTGPD